ncbi:MAG TPA: BPL-N domain-containing protein [Rhabdochlamydiaceae bacterium]|nr:BPL-N domain-containing protein [Rhabdochlamydiaceae bacterium]
MVQALVYSDKGVCLPSAKALEEQLKRLLGPTIAVIQVDGEYLRTQKWEDKTVVLAMGGGVCSEWDQQLQMEGIQKIQNYVRGGGKYIGFCAGAYFAAAKSCFGAVEKNRPLAFFPGKAVGPLVDGDYLSLSGARAAEVSFKMKGVVVGGVLYYQGGCLFDVEEDSAAVEIIGIYRGLEKAAAVFCRVGKGCAFLCGMHPEFKWSIDLSKGANKKYQLLVKKLSPHEMFREKVWEEIGNKLGLISRPSYFDIVWKLCIKIRVIFEQFLAKLLRPFEFDRSNDEKSL